MSAQPEPFDLRSADVTASRIAQLLRLFPEVRTEGGKLDFDRLRLALGDAVDTGRERYGLTWPGKADSARTIQAPSLATLRPCPEESVDFDTTENLIIEGDNLEVLKLLQKSYLGKVKVIFIDPPYNTNNDFIYPDDYAESLRTYLEYTGQVDADGKKFGTNTETDGRFHSKWLNMMYPRLYLARNLLRDDGVIFIAINDVEMQNLSFIMKEIFGDENLVGTIIWKGATDNNPTRIAIEHEYIVCYSREVTAGKSEWKNRFDVAKLLLLDEYHRLRTISGNDVAYIQVSLRKFIRANSEVLDAITHYSRVDERGPYTGSRKVHNPKPGGYKYDVVHPKTGRACVSPINGYRYPKARMDSLISDDRILFGDDDTQVIQIKEYLQDYEGKLSSVISLDSRAGANDMEALFGDRRIFPHPKPVDLVRDIADFCLEKDDIAVDFFAGSGTVAHAILDLNQQDGGNRRFILVQLPEPTEYPDYPTIADITKERIRRVIVRLNDADSGKLDLNAKQDRGFRVFKLAESSFTPWEASQPHDAAALERQLELHIEHIRPDRSEADLLYEILLKSGFPLTVAVETLLLAEKCVYSVGSGDFFVCLERGLTLEVIRAMAARKPTRVVCLDVGFAGNDQLKTNAVQIFKTAGVAKFSTV